MDELAWSQGVQDEPAWSQGFQPRCSGGSGEPSEPPTGCILVSTSWTQSKETNTGADGITKVAGGTQIAAAASVEQQDGFAVAFDRKPQQLDRVKSLYFPEDPTVTCATDVCACRVHNPSRIEYLSAYCVRNPSHFFLHNAMLSRLDWWC